MAVSEARPLKELERENSELKKMVAEQSLDGSDRNAGYPAPLAQIPACATNALGSCLRYERQSVV